MSAGAPRKLEPRFVERIWGRKTLEPLFGVFDRPIGEVWFADGPDSPLLVKFIFTSDRLSVQVHPDDEYAAAHENSRGKTEMWHILAAEPGAVIATGFRGHVEKEQLRQAILDGSVESLLHWQPVQSGDTLFVPAGVVHAIGGGITLCEIQQNSDVTYRLYDYGRPRELHLERGLAVANTGVYEAQRRLPLQCEYFHTDLLELRNGKAAINLNSDSVLIVLAGAGNLGGEPFGAGEAWRIEAGSSLEIAASEPARFLHTTGAPAAVARR